MREGLLDEPEENGVAAGHRIEEMLNGPMRPELQFSPFPGRRGRDVGEFAEEAGEHEGEEGGLGGGQCGNELHVDLREGCGVDEPVHGENGTDKRSVRRGFQAADVRNALKRQVGGGST